MRVNTHIWFCWPSPGQGKDVPCRIDVAMQRQAAGADMLALSQTFLDENGGGAFFGRKKARSANFGDILRREVNNPLNGILANAEMLLARLDALPAWAIERLETIAHLAVRLRETVRRLSSAAELRHVG